MHMNQVTRKRLIWAAVFVGFWTTLGVLASIESYIAQLTYDKRISWGLAFGRTFKDVGAFAFLSLGIIWLCKRLPLIPGRWRTWFLIHFCVSFVFALGHVALISILMAGEKSVQTGEILTFGYLFQKLAVHYTLSNVLKYWILVLGCLGWHYYRGYRERERQAAALNEELVRARLQALRMQLNPHFLFNTLNAISALIHDNPEAADKMLVRLSELLRLSLDQDKPQELPLREELAFLDRYLDIEKIRFGDRLQVERRIEPETRDAMVPCLILQPLVENAIRHAIEPMETAGRLTICAEKRDTTLHLRVIDNGPGLDPEKMENTHGGIGLSNTRSRLSHLYGEAARLLLIPLAEGGLEVHIELPFRTGTRQD